MFNGYDETCSIPVDAEYFDEFGFLQFEQLPKKGEQAALTSFQLPRQYCGVLTYFAQYADHFFFNNAKIYTPGLIWIIRRNEQPLFPYHKMEGIINPWGYGGFEFSIRLDENAKVDFIVYNRDFNDFNGTEKNNPPIDKISMIGGRIIGRYWYNRKYGDIQNHKKYVY